MSQLTAESAANVGETRYMLTDGRNHSLLEWCATTAREIFHIDEVADERMEQAKIAQAHVGAAMLKHFQACLDEEKSLLLNDINHFDAGFDFIMKHINGALDDVQALDNFWSDVISSKEWREAAMRSVGNMMATMVHIERLWYADDNPDNVSATTYKSKFIGV